MIIEKREKMQEISQILMEADKLLEENKGKAAEQLLLDSIVEARQQNENGQILQLLNELIGYYRVSSEKDKLLRTIDESVNLLEVMKLQGTIPYATTLLNAANGYRSIGYLDKSLEYYKKTEEIYLSQVGGNDMLLAGFYNNFSLLYQEMSEYKNAEECLLKALEIVQENHAEFEIAVTFANLANTAVLGKKFQQAEKYAKEAISYFEHRNLYDTHYCAAISALGMCYYYEGRSEQAKEILIKGMKILEDTVGKNSQYKRLAENLQLIMKSTEEKTGEKTGTMKGLKLSRMYYETFGKPMLEKEFPEYLSKIAVGLAGKGSDCMGFDDEFSQDHDWGPDFCIWVTDETFAEIGDRLKEAYDHLPIEFLGYTRKTTSYGKDRRGVMRISDFYKSLVGTSVYEEIDWREVNDYALAAAVSGEVFVDEEGVFSDFRHKLLSGYPEEILYVKLAEDVSRVSQTGQYNYFRLMERGDRLSADRMLSDYLGHVMVLQHHLCNTYPPHDKWLYKSCRNLDNGEELCGMLASLHHCLSESNENVIEHARRMTEEIGDFLAKELYAKDLISDIDSYVGNHTDELLQKAVYSKSTDKELVDKIARLEFEAFDLVQNEGGRASCQNDWPTFSVMRKSQYLTWNRTMLLQYLYDFQREFNLGHNLITEKYGRMMESTAPEKYQELAQHFPAISEQKKAVIEQIVAVQMNMVEEFGKEHPRVIDNARDLHTYEDNIFNTSYETYLRGEISTYSDKMLQLYGRYVVECLNQGINIAEQTITNTARLYGYADLESFEKA